MTLHPDIINTRKGAKRKFSKFAYQSLWYKGNSTTRIFNIWLVLAYPYKQEINQNKIQLITLNNFEFYYERHRLHQQNSITKDVDYKI